MTVVSLLSNNAHSLSYYTDFLQDVNDFMLAAGDGAMGSGMMEAR
ncbi:hypothetical protein PCCS19_01530 [Paenibacillus sp. CCS19]|nr:hypothetical protein [Paenibacillus cellulosilyticus]GMK37100.1 hypothetical protein PCCS19_01530 [Paenibacillus cellulosilyticus]